MIKRIDELIAETMLVLALVALIAGVCFPGDSDPPLSNRDLIAAIESQRAQIRDLSARLTADQRKTYRAHVEFFVDEVDKAGWPK